MKRVTTWTLLGVFATGCVVTQTKAERGPLLKTYERNAVRQSGGVQAAVTAKWPELTFSFSEFDLCGVQKVETYEEKVTFEKKNPATVPALAVGAPLTVAGVALLLARGAFSNTPGAQIDGSGRYGAPPRQLATGWGIGLVSVGVPVLAVGLVSLFASGTSHETRQVEEIAQNVETPCHARKVNGEVTFLGQGKVPKEKATRDGVVTFTAKELRGNDFDSVLLQGRATVASKEDAERLAAFGACLEVIPLPPAAELAKKDPAALGDLLLAAQACGSVPGAPASEAVRRLEDEQLRRP
ncbi:MAG: hypothetical protein ACT4TC_01090 [Myxococcaceae bacterium]